jgi:hypothetical protein
MPAETVPAKNQQLVNRLIAKTKSGDVEWSAGPHDGVFVAVLGVGTVEIAQRVDTSEIGEGGPLEWFELIVMTGHGAVASVLSTNPQMSLGAATQCDCQLLAELYRLARSVALDTNNILDELLEELS